MSALGPMRSVRLSAAQSTYLLAADYLPADLRETIAAEVAASTAPGGTTIELGADVAERFRESFTERLAKFGFDSSYQLTEEGAALEELIDVFFGETE